MLGCFGILARLKSLSQFLEISIFSNKFFLALKYVGPKRRFDWFDKLWFRYNCWSHCVTWFFRL